ncbi:hypothetical protein [Anaerofustis stercorihominis]|uniref:hypothetical protein n=1 Tax=Anaerofustis stercorihominis TaxID=214853 RepID=UPI00214AFBD4|nr:hypothetical protein [Anaerofustis stercorihominis]MCR2032920.1 hypothetical protein [Anaerofustis stercorihominis]
MDKKYLIQKTNLHSFHSEEIPPNGRIFMLKIKDLNNGYPKGIIHNLFFIEPYTFLGFDDAILKINQMMDILNNPQSFTKLRTFFDKEYKHTKKFYDKWLSEGKEKNNYTQYWDPKSLKPNKKDIIVFYINVIYRRNSSWQGEVIWKGHRKVAFRSVLELLNLIRSAILNDKYLVKLKEQY